MIVNDNINSHCIALVSNWYSNENYSQYEFLRYLADICFRKEEESGIILCSKAKQYRTRVNPRKNDLSRWNNLSVTYMFCWSYSEFTKVLLDLVSVPTFLFCLLTTCLISRFASCPLANALNHLFIITFSTPILNWFLLFAHLRNTRRISLCCPTLCWIKTQTIGILEGIIKSCAKYWCLSVGSDSFLKQFRL